MKSEINNILVLKIGTSTLVKKSADGQEKLDVKSFKQISSQILELKKSGSNIIVVSSGAITAGMIETGLKSRPKDIPELQRLASIGWRKVLNAWSRPLSNNVIGGLLLTQHELDLKTEREEALQVIHALLKHGDIVVVNENDAITHAEIAFGDNDTLAATLATKISDSSLFGNSTRLVLLSDVDGVYADINDPSSVIATISNIESHEHYAGDSLNHNGTGGMITKLQAASIAKKHGVETWVANGRTKDCIKSTINGEIGTHFV